MTTSLFLDRDPARRLASVQKVITCEDNFINTYPDDGGCEEGCSYWNEAPGTMLEVLELLNSATRGRVNIWHEPLIRRMGEYIVDVRIADNLYMNSGDAHSFALLDRDKLFRYGKYSGSSLLTAMAAANLPEDYLPRTLPGIFSEAPMRAELRQPSPFLKDVWLPQTAFMAARMTEDSTDGLYLACIAADNGKSHSHNDTGSFWLYLDGEPVIMDLGGESYQKQSFDSHRYELASTQSAYHNLPTIGAVQQGVGSAFRATQLRYAKEEFTAALEMNLAEAYPAEAELQDWIRRVSLDRRVNRITVSDRFSFRSAPKPITWSLMTCRPVTIEDGKLYFTSGVATKLSTIWSTVGALPAPQSSKPAASGRQIAMEYNPAMLTAEVETVTLTNPGLIQSWGPTVNRVLLKTKQTNTNGESKLVFYPRSS